MSSAPRGTASAVAPADIRIEGVVQRFGDHLALAGVDLHIRAGEFFSLLGPSGCGKTTLLNIIAGFLDPSEGSVYVGDRDVTALPPYRRDIGMVFQNYALFPHLDVAGNVAYGLKVRKVPAAQIKKRVAEVLDLVQLPGYASRMPHQLSGGQQQRVAIARALAISPQVLLLDEPLSNLDAKLRKDMQSELRSLQQRIGITTVLVTHDQEEALSLSDRIGILGTGRLQQVGTPLELYRKPANRFVAEFIGQANLIKAQPTSVAGVFEAVDRFENEGQGLLLGTELDITATQPLRFVLRPERIRVVPAPAPDPRPTGRPVIRSPNRTGGTLRELTYSGGSIRLVIALYGGGELVAQAEDAQFNELPVIGQPLALTWRIEDVVPLPAEEEVPA
ncbi:ABC transporter ATP-binding protein [Pigmentiphaga aceris]|uniref:Spermidine/putrescine import ATP-binding protein PotA n=1 Tax=Pigmentiphaga aceris TaxID=1940612 RepID=A0A5C0AX16_9BURK|nr:ABC transporter ATP-binding protein [Pigmentiphaga aceris]QEI05943.1 ABC transporter ATP-binding protein [Pigmentiphaga aceris]